PVLSFVFISFLFFSLMLLPPPRSTLFPYTTLFRSLINLPPALILAVIILLRPVALFHSVLTPRTVLLRLLLLWLALSALPAVAVDRKSTRLNSSHVKISYAVFCLKKKRNSS